MKPPMFSFMFICEQCSEEVEAEIPLAIAQSQAGGMVKCKCNAGYLITTQGAARIKQLLFIDAEGDMFIPPPYNADWES